MVYLGPHDNQPEWFEQRRREVERNVDQERERRERATRTAQAEAQRLTQAATCYCTPCRIACLTQADRDWLQVRGWQPPPPWPCEQVTHALTSTQRH